MYSVQPSYKFLWLSVLGTEVVIKCNGSIRPVLSSDWVRENITSKDWYAD